MRTHKKCRSSYGSLGAVSGWHRSIHVGQLPQEPCGGAERIWRKSLHRRGLPGIYVSYTTQVPYPKLFVLCANESKERELFTGSTASKVAIMP